jgi:hypothetical protein
VGIEVLRVAFDKTQAGIPISAKAFSSRRRVASVRQHHVAARQGVNPELGALEIAPLPFAKQHDE